MLELRRRIALLTGFLAQSRRQSSNVIRQGFRWMQGNDYDMKSKAILPAVYVLVTLSGGCAHRRPHGPTDSRVKCFEIDLGPWSPADRVGAVHFGLPKRVILDSATASIPGVTGMQLRPVVPSGGRPGVAWWRSSNDSVVMTWSNGFSSVSIRAGKMVDGRLEGRAVAQTDYIQLPWPTAEARGIPVECTEEESDEDSRRHK